MLLLHPDDLSLDTLSLYGDTDVVIVSLAILLGIAELVAGAWNLRFTPDGRLIALVRVDDAWTVAIDGKRWENEYDFVWDLKLSADGKVIAVLAKRGMEYIVLANDKAWENGFISMRETVISSSSKSPISFGWSLT